MTNCIFRAIIASIFILNISLAVAQVNIKPAIALFDRHDYDATISMLEPMARTNDRDAKINYYLGASYVQVGRNLSDAIKRLKLAQIKGYAADSHFYLGRAYQLQYEYEIAQAEFDRYVKQSKNAELIELAKKYRLQCENSVALANKIFTLRVIDKYRVSPDSLLLVYNPSREVGSVARNSTFFDSDIDPDGVLYRTERGDAVYFSLVANDGYSHLYKMEKLLDGWGEMQMLPGIQTNGNDKMPVMMTDGQTLYFASDREGGMGGFDIYRSTYDIESRTFTEPVNIGVPFNSAADDYLFVADEFRTRAWFASNRASQGDSTIVYEILWDDSVIRNFAQSTEDIRNAAALNIDKSLSKMRDNITSAGTSRSSFSVTREQKKFEFQVNDSLIYTQWEHFKSEDALSLYQVALASQSKRDSLSQAMSVMRKQFASTNSDEERDAIIGKVLSVERVVYALEDELDGQYKRVRMLENQKIMELVESDSYVSLSDTKLKSSLPVFKWDEILRKDNFAMYSDVAFAEVRSSNRFYKTLFDEREREELFEADSLYAWAGILALEAQKLHENADNDDLQRANYLNMASVVLYGKALDQKFDIFDDKYNEAIEDNADVDFTEITVLRKSAVRDFGLVENVTLADGLTQMQRAGVMKKRGMASFTDAMKRYAAHVDGSFLLPAKQRTSEPLSVITNAPKSKPAEPQVVAADEDDDEEVEEVEQLPQKVEEPKPEVEEPVVEEKQIEPVVEKPLVNVSSDATVSPFGNKPVYRIQLGVFRNKPDATKLTAFDVVTSVSIPEKGLTKYYGGAYRTYSEASSQLKSITGFSGAFIVAFMNGEQVKLSVAQKAE
ncbi:MAG: hypothetical protein MJZ01_05765 [Bacteroidales bacterium]|nr:hypothetical protein [Bacteroidales bacterium]